MTSDIRMEGGQGNVDVRDGKTSGKKGGKCGRALLILLFLAMVGCIIGLAVALTRQKQKQAPTTVTSTVAPPTDDEEEAPKSATGLYRFGAVASDREECSRAGTEILAKYRGSAVDAALATLICIGVMHLPVSGIGGGFFMTIHDKEKNEVVTLNAREVAPLSATEDMYVNKSGTSVLGGLAIAVPGQIAGYAEAHKRYGKVPWSTLFQSAIRYCEEGFVMNDFLQYVTQVKKHVLDRYDGIRKIFTLSDGSIAKKGDVIKRPQYAKTLRRIAEEGPATFYNGSLAEDIVNDIQDEGGIITLEDLKNYTALWKTPVEVTLSNGEYKLYGPPPPSSAAVMYYILNIMNGYNVSSADRKTFKARVLLAHRLVEAMKFGFGKRSFLGDEDFVNVTEWVERLTSNAYAEETRQKINDDRVLDFDDYESAYSLVNDNGTTHLCVYGPDGIAVSVTSTVNTYLASGVVGNRTGIIFNNEMDDFSTPGTDNYFHVRASPSNYIVPGKRPMSSMSPTIVLDKDNNTILVVGSSGGTRIISGTLEVILNSLWLGYNVTEALDQPRYHHQLLPDKILHEVSWPLDIQEALKLKGHKLEIKDNFCVTQIIKDECKISGPDRVPDGRCVQAASDVRRLGAPDGY